jgi:predicted tellurium resistance membrane protein TerC
VDEILTLNALAALATLSHLEIVLGIDNVVFLAILTGKLPPEQQGRARTLGLAMAAAGRIALLCAISWIITLDKTVLLELPFDLPGGPHVERAAAPAAGSASDAGSSAGTDESPAASRAVTAITVKDLVLILGGLFLLAKSTWEIGHQLEPKHPGGAVVHASLAAVLVQIVAIDLVFSIDSVLTAVGMVKPDEYEHYWAALAIMIAAVLLAIGVMILFSGPIAMFVNRHHSVKMLALAFLILIGVVLVAEGLHSHVPRAYIYVTMTFSLAVEVLNLRAGARALEARETETAI